MPLILLEIGHAGAENPCPSGQNFRKFIFFRFFLLFQWFCTLKKKLYIYWLLKYQPKWYESDTPKSTIQKPTAIPTAFTFARSCEMRGA
jgi:hypothetical protein